MRKRSNSVHPQSQSNYPCKRLESVDLSPGSSISYVTPKTVTQAPQERIIETAFMAIGGCNPRSALDMADRYYSRDLGSNRETAYCR